MRNQNTEGRRQKTVGATLCGRPGQPRRVAPTRAFFAVLSLITALFVSACGSGGGSATSPSGTITFTASNSSPDNNTVYMATNSVSGDTLTVDVKASNLSSSVYGAAFDVDFDSSKMTYSSYSAGSFLEQGGSGVTYLVSPQSGKLVVGISKQGAVSGVSGSGTLVTLKFNVTGSSTVAFSNTSLKDSSNQPISGVTWSGGTVTVL